MFFFFQALSVLTDVPLVKPMLEADELSALLRRRRLDLPWCARSLPPSAILDRRNRMKPWLGLSSAFGHDRDVAS